MALKSTLRLTLHGDAAPYIASLEKAKAASKDASSSMSSDIDKASSKVGTALHDLGNKLGKWGVPFSSSITQMGDKLNGLETEGMSTFGALGKAAGVSVLAIGAAAGLAGYESLKAASSFQSAMEMIRTQAGASQGEVNKMSAALVNMASSVGMGPSELATGLYHVESVGLRGAKALNVLKVAAEGAQIGHANLEDVTNALDSAIVSGIPGVQNYGQAMGSLNAIVGAGDMKMQDLADAMGTGILAVSKNFGLSLNDVGAALAVFGDNNIRGAKAATELRMALQYSSEVSKTGAKALAGIGMSATEMAQDFHSGGLVKGLQDLQNHLTSSGVSAANTGQLLTAAFGKKAGVGLQVLLDQLPRLKTKYHEIATGALKFGSDWKATKNTVAFQVSSLKAGFDALEIKVGKALLPIAMKILKWFNAHWPQISNAVSHLGAVFTTVGNAISDVFKMFDGSGSKHSKHLSAVMTQLGATVRTIKQIFSDVFDGVKGLFQTAIPLIEAIWHDFGANIMGFISGVMIVIEGQIRGPLKVIEGIFEIATGILTGKWGKAWKGIKDVLKGIWIEIESIVQGGVKMLENMLGPISKILSGVTGFFGKLFGGGGSHGAPASAGIRHIGVPRMALGGMVTQPTLALIGEAGPEMVVPLNRAGVSNPAPLPGASTSISHNPTYQIILQGTQEQLVAKLRQLLTGHDEALLNTIGAHVVG